MATAFIERSEKAAWGIPCNQRSDGSLWVGKGYECELGEQLDSEREEAIQEASKGAWQPQRAVLGEPQEAGRDDAGGSSLQSPPQGILLTSGRRHRQSNQTVRPVSRRSASFYPHSNLL